MPPAPPSHPLLPFTSRAPLLTIVHTHLLHSCLWRDLEVFPLSSPWPLLSGLPPSPVYTDPDADPHAPRTAQELAQREWVLPVDLREKMTPRLMAGVFDSLPEGAWGVDAKGRSRGKRILLAVCAEDSAVVYYFVHDGVVKPRQN